MASRRAAHQRCAAKVARKAGLQNSVVEVLRSILVFESRISASVVLQSVSLFHTRRPLQVSAQFVLCLCSIYFCCCVALIRYRRIVGSLYFVYACRLQVCFDHDFRTLSILQIVVQEARLPPDGTVPHSVAGSILKSVSQEATAKVIFYFVVRPAALALRFRVRVKLQLRRPAWART